MMVAWFLLFLELFYVVRSTLVIDVILADTYDEFIDIPKDDIVSKQRMTLWLNPYTPSLGCTLPMWTDSDKVYRAFNMVSFLTSSCVSKEVLEIDFGQNHQTIKTYKSSYKNTLELMNFRSVINTSHIERKKNHVPLPTFVGSPISNERIKIWIDDDNYFEDYGVSQLDIVWQEAIMKNASVIFSPYPFEGRRTRVEANVLNFPGETGARNLYQTLIYVRRNSQYPHGYSVLMHKKESKWSFWRQKLLNQRLYFALKGNESIATEFTELCQANLRTSHFYSKKFSTLYYRHEDGGYTFGSMFEVDPAWVPQIPESEIKWMPFLDVYENQSSILEPESLAMMQNLYSLYAMRMGLLPMENYLVFLEKKDNRTVVYLKCQGGKCEYPLHYYSTFIDEVDFSQPEHQNQFYYEVDWNQISLLFGISKKDDISPLAWSKFLYERCIKNFYVIESNHVKAIISSELTGFYLEDLLYSSLESNKFEIENINGIKEMIEFPEVLKEKKLRNALIQGLFQRYGYCSFMITNKISSIL